MVEEFRVRRNAFVRQLADISGIACIVPLGAFYAYPNVAASGRDSKELEVTLLNEGGVGCLAGSAFGGTGSQHLRFSMANSLQNLELAAKRISDCMNLVTVRR